MIDPSPAPSSEAAQSSQPESQDSPQNQQPMQLDGDAQTLRKTLVAKLQRYQQTLAGLHPTEDSQFVLRCKDVISETKQEIILLNTPQDQLRNLQAALARKQLVNEDLTVKINELQYLRATTTDEIAEMMLREKTLMTMIQNSPGMSLPGADDQPTTEQFMLLQSQLSILHSQLNSERQLWGQQLQLLQSVPNLPEEAVMLLPVLAAPDPHAPATPTGIPVHSAPGTPTAAATNPEPFANGFESFAVDDDYGPGASASSQSRQRPQPYGPAAPTVIADSDSFLDPVLATPPTG